ncbi:MAG TPA: polyhydroxyalkanoate synthesis repressor PhaR [Nevskiales bacterium]|nr:polyhydroxyalkanoate synthesis repressor PhaR [Nevskiales bacterium]
MTKPAAKPRIIKKYPNRRLYDTEISRYITLDEIRQLVVDGVEFEVQDSRDGSNITRSILLQVISEQEEGGNPIFSTEVLTRFIRFYGDSMQPSISRYLELSLRSFAEQQQQFIDNLRQLLHSNTPLQTLRDISRQQLPIWKSIRKEFLKNLSRSRSESQE